MPVIAMTQEMGALAKDVALKLAETLNIEAVRDEVVEHVAEKMSLPKSAIRRLREGKAGFIERIKTDQRSMGVYTAEEVFSQASKGNVVLRGWGATCLLRPVQHVPCVRITSSFEKRLAWVMTNLETDDREFAAAEIRRSDEAHASRMNKLFGVNWGDPVLYDLVLNTERVSVESCVEQIILLANRPEFQETEASRATLANLALEARIRSALVNNAATKQVHITIEAHDGQVVLSGIVLDDIERDCTENVVSTLQGVQSVDNQLRTMTSPKQFMSSKYHLPRQEE
jgi:cytidylate kinase